MKGVKKVKNKNITVIVATHKKYKMPSDKMYLPLHVGAEGKEELEYKKDNTGENISTKNPFFCELTGLYWAWKNLNSEYIGLAHYRRHFSLKRKSKNKFENVLSLDEADKLLENTNIILPRKRNYFIESVYSHYKHTMYIEPMDKVGEIIKEKYPNYYLEFERLKKTTKMHAFNMFIMKKELLDSYCNWLFDILFELENEIDVTKYNKFHARLFGRISERLLDVWIRTNKYDYKEIKVINMENTNWLKKGTSFLRAKFGGKKYEKSF